MRTTVQIIGRTAIMSAVIIAGTTVMGATLPAHLRFEQSVAVARSTIEVTNAELHRLEPYVSTNQDGEQRLDIAAASASGTTPTTIVLAADLVRYQNALRLKVRESGSDNVPLDDYPEVKKFFNAATTEAARRIRQAGKSNRSSLDMAAVEPCGDWNHSVPAQAPPHVNSGSEPSLEIMGFHKTAGYACGANTEYECASDYTRGRDYNGPYGHCDSPRFRDQEHLVNDGKWIQFGEPNPEIGDYLWPYWNWGAYVKWWHDNH